MDDVLIVEDESVLLIEDHAADILTIGTSSTTLVEQPAGADFIVVDTAATETRSVEAPADLVVVSEHLPAEVLSAPDEPELVVLTSAGLPGDRGPIGPTGPMGPIGSEPDLLDLTIVFENGLY